MTTLTVLGSGSQGNAFALAARGATLLLDAGFSAREIEQRAELAGVDLGGLVGVALTHEHGDHTRGAVRLARRHRVPVLASPGTWRAIAGDGVAFVPIRASGRVECGPFTLSATPILHDAAEPLALGVEVAEGPALGLAYDFGRPTQALRYLFRAVTAVVLEANYDELLLRTSGYPPAVQHRIAGSGGHLSNRATAQLLDELWHPGLTAVVLAHLSQRCNTPAAARSAVEPTLRARGFCGELAVAEQEWTGVSLAVPDPGRAGSARWADGAWAAPTASG